MYRPEMKEVISILMESSLYFLLPVKERLELVQSFVHRVKLI